MATDQLLIETPGLRIADVRFHDVPHVLTDGRLVAWTLPTWNIVFTLEDGSMRLETFTCDMHGNVGGSSRPVYQQFCPEPQVGPERSGSG